MQRSNNKVDGSSIQVLDAVDVFKERTDNRMSSNGTAQKEIVSLLFLLKCAQCQMLVCTRYHMIRLIIRTRLTLTKTGQKPYVNPSIYNSMCSLDFGDDLFFLYLTCVHLSIYYVVVI